MDQNSGLFTVIAYFFKVFTNLRFHTGWSILLQVMEDLSDRELEKYLSENTSGKWFCGFSLMEAIGHNLKRLVVLEAPPLLAG